MNPFVQSMEKLHQRSEVLFAVAFILLYVVGCSVTDNLSLSAGLEKCVTVPFQLLLCALLFGFIAGNGLQGYYGLCRPAQSAGRMLFYLPLILLSLVNVWFGIVVRMAPLATAVYVLSMLLSGVLEELIFRGLLFNAMRKDSLTRAVIVSSLTFGIGHIVNLINGSGAELAENLCQVCYAVAIGFLFVLLFLRTGSLLPSLLSHSVFNALSAFSNEAAFERLLLPTALALIVLSLGYAAYLWKKVPPAEAA